MSGAGATDAGWPRGMEAAASMLLLVLPTLALQADKAVVPLLIVAGVLVAAAWLRQRAPVRPDGWIALPALALAGVAALSSAWSPDLPHGLLLVARLVPVVLCGGALIAAFAGAPTATRARLADWLLAGVGAALVLLLAERVGDFAVRRLLHGEAASQYHLVSGYNRGITMLALLLWPAALACARRWGRAAAAGAMLAALVLIAGFESGAAVMAMGAGLLAAAVAALGRGAGFAVLLAGLLAAFLAVPLLLWLGLGDLLREANAAGLPATIDSRVEIWSFVAERVRERPLLGWGMDAARFMSGEGPWPGVSPIKLHPHNNPLQLMLELGLAGTLPALMLLGRLARRASAGPPPQRACRAGFFATALAVACTAYGLWQTQWITSLLLGVAVLLLVAPMVDEDRPAPSAGGG